ncbi:polyprenyl synthetase family protein [Saccharopolyspora hirsuta]|uniref:Polyprenyl synthetase family protein n=1 Tax=Saccharopolyspora hirsuta TaxID=1837 RepID=A0A5M7BX01_SACHI|nr:polyprenyl synthetase family protein [Saccharopolyspora hirsuta]KAA5831774.1 polyprenyl synthetase family protein [Saccharopolyspora hirsuta]
MTALDEVPDRAALRLPGSDAAPDPVQAAWNNLLPDARRRYQETLAARLEPQRDYLTSTEYAIYHGGKKLRPLLLLLSAHLVLGSQSAPQKVVDGAVALEMLHVATLIHDDVVDDSLLRRGMASVNAVRGAETAIIVGDMQFVQAVRGFIDVIDRERDMDLVKMVLDTAFRVCCGELDELQVNPSWDTDVLLARYWETIDRKTAVLFGLACEAGVVLAGGRTADARRAGFFGRRIGRAFQVMDDLFGLVQDAEKSGKPRGMDLARRRASLPIIYALDELGPDHPVTRAFRGGEPVDGDRAANEVRHTRGFARAYADARAQALDALEYLRPFHPGPHRAAMADLALHVVDRAP